MGKVHTRAHLVEEEEDAPKRKLRNFTQYAKKFRKMPVPTAATRAGLRTTRRSEDSLPPTTLLTTATTVQLTTHVPTIDQSRSTKRSTMSPKGNSTEYGYTRLCRLYEKTYLHFCVHTVYSHFILAFRFSRFT